jgi:uncharacterized protein
MAAVDPQRAFLGVGWAFPPRLDADGRIAEAVYDEDVRQAILIILGTNPGERVMRPSFGAGLDRVVFEPINAATLTEVEARVREAVVAWDPRAEVEQVRVTQQGNPPAVLLIELHYRVRATNTRDNLVYPFYLQEGSGG